eukprot:snap_masked-scaffold_71-processed-gene-0.46-mRNA-1 protein AED:0.04 eAED:0.04 QI:0/-1/0/1/-1/1/1/0/82
MQYDLLNPPAEIEARKHKLKRLIPTPNSYFMDVKCKGCNNITVLFSHAQSAVMCSECGTVLCQPTGGKAKLAEGVSYRKKSS